MAKADFCFTYYDGDAARDVQFLSRLEKGGYLDIVHSQRIHGHLTLDFIKRILGQDFEKIWPQIEIILKTDSEGKFYLEWLERSEIKAKTFSRIQSDKGFKKGENKAKRKPSKRQTKTESIPNTNQTQTERLKTEHLKEDGDGDGSGDVNGFGIGTENGFEVGVTLHTNCKNLFVETASKKDKIVTWDGRMGKSLNQILEKIKTPIRAKQGSEPDEQGIFDGFSHLITHLPPFYETGFDLNTINSKFDAIVNEIRSGNKKLTKSDQVTKANKEQFERIQKGEV